MFKNIRLSLFTILAAALIFQSCKSENTSQGMTEKDISFLILY